MTTINAFIKSHPLLSYVALTFAISWGAILIVAGPGGLLGTKEVSEVLFPSWSWQRSQVPAWQASC